jgi:tetratricopeptide (TPR) repeat protein
MGLVVWIGLLSWAAPNAEIDGPHGSPPPTVLVLPFEGDTLGDLDRGGALARQVRRLLHNSGEVQVFHRQQLPPVEERLRTNLANFAPEARARALGERLGADWVISGRLEHGPEGLSLILTRTAVLEIEARSLTVDGSGLGALWAHLPERLSELLPAAAPGLPTGVGAPLTPQRERALLHLAACERRMERQALGFRAPALRREEGLEEAEVHCRAAQRADPRWSEPHGELALLAAWRGEKTMARQALQRADKSDPGAQLAAVYLHEAAPALIAALTAQVEAEPGTFWWRELLADAQLAQGQWPEAQVTLQSAHRAARRQPGILRRLGEVAIRMGEVEEGLELTERALRLSPEDPELLLAMAEGLEAADRPDEAELMLERCSGPPELEAQAHLLRARLAEKKGATGAIEAELEAVLAADPQLWRARGEARYALARLYDRSGDGARAEAQWEAAARGGYLDLAAGSGIEGPQFRALRVRLATLQGKSRRAPAFVAPLPVDPATGRLRGPGAARVRARF